MRFTEFRTVLLNFSIFYLLEFIPWPLGSLKSLCVSINPSQLPHLSLAQIFFEIFFWDRGARWWTRFTEFWMRVISILLNPSISYLLECMPWPLGSLILQCVSIRHSQFQGGITKFALCFIPFTVNSNGSSSWVPLALRVGGAGNCGWDHKIQCRGFGIVSLLWY